MIAQQLADTIEAVVRHFPGPIGHSMRRAYYRRRFKHLGRNVIIEPGVRFFGCPYVSIGDGTHIDFDCIIAAGPHMPGRAEVLRVPNAAFDLSDGQVSIGKGVHLAAGCHILGHGGVRIGDYCGCAGGVRILSLTNHYAGIADRSRRDVYFSSRGGEEHAVYIAGPVVLGRNVGVAANCVLLPGTCLSDESFLAIGSVARGFIEPNSVASGNPAARRRDRFRPPADA